MSMVPMTASLENQVAVVTGASSGIGKAIALGLAAKGVRLALVGRKLETLEMVAEDARTVGPQVLCYRADLTVDGDIQQLTKNLHDDFGFVDMLIYSAGVISLADIETAPAEDLDWHYRTNVRAPYVLTRALLTFLKSREGQVVFINSSAGLKAAANASHYAATKHALKAIADSLREEVNASGLRVLSVFLGRTASPMQMAVHTMEGREYHPELLMQPEDVAAMVVDALSLPRSAEVTEIRMRPLKKSY